MKFDEICNELCSLVSTCVRSRAKKYANLAGIQLHVAVHKMMCRHMYSQNNGTIFVQTNDEHCDNMRR